jgi:hypothetical protein
LLLTFHKPVWYHHQLLITIPVALLAGIAAGDAVQSIPQAFQKRNLTTISTIAALVLFGIIIAIRWPVVFPDFNRPSYLVTHGAPPPWAEQMFLTKMENHAANSEWVVTNLPMYAFRVGLPVPPHLAVISEKRILTGELSESQIVATIQSIQPALVLIGRREFPDLETYLATQYRLLYERGKRQLYLRSNRKDQP